MTLQEGAPDINFNIALSFVHSTIVSCRTQVKVLVDSLGIHKALRMSGFIMLEFTFVSPVLGDGRLSNHHPKSVKKKHFLRLKYLTTMYN